MTAQLVWCLLYKHKDVILIPRTHILKKLNAELYSQYWEGSDNWITEAP